MKEIILAINRVVRTGPIFYPKTTTRYLIRDMREML